MLDDTFPGLCETLWREMQTAQPSLSIVGVLADYLEERGDLRAEGLREMRVQPCSDHPVGCPADRELLRVAWEMVTVECPGCYVLMVGNTAEHSAILRTGCVSCSGRGRVPAWVECCSCNNGKIRGGWRLANDASSLVPLDCSICHGKGWIKRGIQK